jgi:hypothetical protein
MSESIFSISHMMFLDISALKNCMGPCTTCFIGHRYIQIYKTHMSKGASTVSRTKGQHHRLADHCIPYQQGDSIAIDFIGPLPEDDGCDIIIMFTDRLNSDYHLVATRSDLTAEQLMTVFFDELYCENGLPQEIISDRDKLFTSKFWAMLPLPHPIPNFFITHL